MNTEYISVKKSAAILLCNVFEYYDLAVYATLASILAANFFATESALVANVLVWSTFSLRFVSRPFGGALFGYLADKIGRKNTLCITCSLMGLATLGMGVLPSSQSIGWLATVLFVLFQLVQSACFGGEYPTLLAYIMERSKAADRPKVSALIVTSSSIGLIMAIGVVALVQSYLSDAEMSAWGWRIPYFLGLVNVMIAFLYRYNMAESPVFIQALAKSVATEPLKLDAKLVLRIVLTAAAGSVLFYLYVTSAAGLAGSLHYVDKNILAIINTSLLIGGMLFTGFVLSRKYTTEQLVRLGAILLLILGVPCYWLTQSQELGVLLLAQLLIAAIASLILAPLSHRMYNLTLVHNRALSLGVGYNVALALFGGTTPLVTLWLSQYSVVAVGVYMSFFGAVYLYSIRLSEKPSTLWREAQS